jgi:hypothetical protein
MHVTSADRTYEDIAATSAQSKNQEYRPPFGRLANCTQALFRSRMCFVGQDSDRPVKHAFNDLGGNTVFLTFLEIATVPIEA